MPKQNMKNLRGHGKKYYSPWVPKKKAKKPKQYEMYIGMFDQVSRTLPKKIPAVLKKVTSTRMPGLRKGIYDPQAFDLPRNRY